MNLTPIDQFKEDIIDICNIYEIAKHRYDDPYDKDLHKSLLLFRDFPVHTLLESCIVAGVSAFEYYLKERLKPQDKRKYNFQSLESVIKLLNNELGIGYTSLNLTTNEIISLKIFFAWRHIIVHNGKRVDKEFIDKVNPLYRRLRIDSNFQKGNRILLEPKPIENFIEVLENFVIKIDEIIAARTFDQHLVSKFKGL